MDIIAYTDGACSGNPGPGGWAVVFSRGSKLRVSGSEKDTTNNRMELKAALKAVLNSAALSNELPLSSVSIHSDSAYVVNAVNKGWLKKWEKNGWKLSSGDRVSNDDLWVLLASALRKAKKAGVAIDFVKVKGHAGDPLNELADKLAREAAEDAKCF